VTVEIDSSIDADVVATQVVKSKAKLKKATPSAVNLATAIVDIQIVDTIKGSSTITLSISDPNFDLLDSGFFDADKDGRMDKIELNYPEGSDLWWRLTQTSITAGETIDMVFMERTAAYLMEKRGPLKVSRAKKTRSEFMLFLCGRVKSGGGIKFISKELHKKQPTGADASETAPAPKDEATRKANKDGGINRKDKITFTNWDGQEYTLKPGELQNAEEALDAAGEAPERAVLALLEAIIVEAPFFRNPSGGDASSVGILQLLNIHFGGSVEARRDIPRVVDTFLKKGFTGRGGAIKLARENPDWSPGQIAQAVQGSAFGDRYEKVRAGAEKVLEAYGGLGGSSGGTYRKSYNFEIGSTDNPHENFWDGMGRLADEVKWPLFTDGPRVYFDPETTLIRQKPVLVVSRDDVEVVDWNYTWDVRNIATELTLTLLCNPFEFRAGEVFKLEGFGAASTGSTAKLPGRWLVEEITRGRYDLSSQFTLKQPERPDPEPASEVGQRAQADKAGSSSDLKDVCDHIDSQNRSYLWGGGHGKLSAIGPKDPLDCSSSCSLALSRADMFKGSDAIVSGDFARSWGEAGRGKDFTVWANAEHVFIQSEGEGSKWRFDTSGGPPSGPHVRDSWRSTSGFTPRHWPGR
jgi:hypothetical protein